MIRKTALALALALATPVSGAEIGPDGLHVEPWFRDTFKDLREDLAEANAEGKRLVIFFEQRGCIYCKKMHEEVLSRDDIASLIEENFFAVQLNLHGDLEVVDFDGDVRSEKQMARKWAVLFTPTILFLPEEVPEGQSAVQAAVANMPGAWGPATTRNMLTWVLEKRYEDQSEEDFQRYHARILSERGLPEE